MPLFVLSEGKGGGKNIHEFFFTTWLPHQLWYLTEWNCSKINMKY